MYNSQLKIGKKRKERKLHEKPSNFESYITKKEFQKGTPVWLNVYHLTCLNYFLQIIGMGIYHTSIEIDSYEYTFGSSKEDVAGFYINKVGEISKLLKLKEKIYMGNTIYTETNIERILALESPYWMGRTYDPFLKNCNHFTKSFLKLILFSNIKYPVYINRICKYAQVFSSFYPPIKRLYGNLQKRETDGSVPYLAGEINYFLKKNRDLTNSDSNFALDNINLRLTHTPINIDNLKEDEKYEKVKNKNDYNENMSINNKSENDSLNEEINSRINKYKPKLIRIMNKDPYLFSLNYSSIYKSQTKNQNNININIESIFNFFKQLQETNNKLIKVCNINQNINSVFTINNLNNVNCISKLKENFIELNKIGENIDACFFILTILIKEKSFHDKNIKIDFDNFIKDNYHLFERNLIMDFKLMNIETLLRLKILHMSNFINFICGNFEKQKDNVEKILLLNQNDFYGLFSLSYIRLIQSNIPESSELINSLLNKNEISKIPFYNYSLNYMKILINETQK